MGGLRPGTETPMTEAAKLELSGHWRHVTDATGLPFSSQGMAREGFIYDTDPAARAVVVVRREGEELAAAYLTLAQRAFYAEGRDVTTREVLAELATIHPAPDKLLGAFHNTFDSLITFINAHHIITIPSTVQPTLEETPPFMRAPGMSQRP